eukprot:TRINITY_DN2412_c0_g1_i1.p1 TRINITY_DN2412_c0_g1~~TRINITY_DN2412_c0_g1_i1.p1  ORF type:complete len:497 (+),score=83.24 TRINITY_DN2412_c0_g1_i1:132-1622(+)
MNWPALSPQCSQAIAEVLKDVVEKRPKDLFGHVISQLEAKSGLDPKQFEAHFLECKARPRTYILEDRCPPHEDPLAWVTMRYSDDTIFLKLTSHAHDLLADVLSSESLGSGRLLFDRACVAYPEIAYLRGTALEQEAAEIFQALHLCASSCPLAECLDDEDANLSFASEALIRCAREKLFKPLGNQVEIGKKIERLEAVAVCLLLRLVGREPKFVAMYGGESETPEKAVLHACSRYIEAVPSFARLPAASKMLVEKTLEAYFPCASLISAETSSVSLTPVKEKVVQLECGIPFFLAAICTEYIAQKRTERCGEEVADILKCVIRYVPGVEKHSAHRAYELYLRKRAERHQWRLMRDDFAHRAVIRLCCLTGSEDTELWNEIQDIVQGLTPEQKQILTDEMGTKDGVTATPAYSLNGSGAIMAFATLSRSKLQPLILLLIKILENCDDVFHAHSVLEMSVDLSAAIPLARDGSGTDLEDIKFQIEQKGPQAVVVHIG